MIHVLATITVRPGKRAEFIAIFNKLVPAVLTEVGCLEYGAAIDLATGLPPQSPIRDDAVIVVEKWKSLDALRAHFTAPHMLAYREQVKDLVTGTALQILTPAVS